MLFDNFEAKSKPPLFYSLCVDSGDEYWDCSSNDADDLNSDSDIDENGTLAQRQQRQLYINKVSECFSNSFGGNTQSNAITSVSGPPIRYNIFRHCNVETQIHLNAFSSFVDVQRHVRVRA